MVSHSRQELRAQGDVKRLVKRKIVDTAPLFGKFHVYRLLQFFTVDAFPALGRFG